MKTSEDHRNTTEWALAHVDGISFVGSLQKFMLANRVTGRAHALYFAGGGATLGFSKPKGQSANPKNLSYTSFKTKKPVQFSDFDGRGARITSIRLPIYSKTYFIIYDGLNPLGKKLAKITMGGFELPQLKLEGQAFVNGAIVVEYGDGKRHGTIKHVLDLPDEDFGPPPPREPYFSIKPFEKPLMVLPGDVMFDFDSHELKTSAFLVLKSALTSIEMRDYQEVIIQGHTDSVGGESYNMDLSIRRARAVKQWLIQNGCKGAQHFIVDGKGESQPRVNNDFCDSREKQQKANNSFSHGRDNKKGHIQKGCAQNRRVEIRFVY
ncbi:outer membrane protein OmpA-like peptidoglycan-associated protein [Catalinimonas alkaloidigena]|uniref:OmpA family protein n=1 Tax=Catalinimonas alkaloidigena TaxID=1075417 RepID=UPI0024057569|nr:OmpA family protein [Catalinimonas alkaloidigena]MDF9796066.1 outer membrane protein OmpA-like peptidoglycan-associated protein [Catalinimonas alkaloidigena]